MRIEVTQILVIEASGRVLVRNMGWRILAEAGDSPAPTAAMLANCLKSFQANATPCERQSDTDPPAAPEEVPADYAPAAQARGDAPGPPEAPAQPPAAIRALTALGIEEQAASMVLAAHPVSRVLSVAAWIMKKKAREPVADPLALLMACLARPT